MTQEYVATFPAGCFAIIARELKTFSLADLKIHQADESAVWFETTLRPERLIELRFFTNLFLVLDAAHLSQYKALVKTPSFRLMALAEGEPTPVEATQKKVLIDSISQQLHIRPNTARQSADFVLIKRRGAEELLTLRLPRAKHKRDKLPRGALRPELAHILLLVAHVKPKDTVLDPFAGYGSIPLEAVRGFGVKHVLAIEQESTLVQRLQGQGFEAMQGNAVQLACPAQSIDKMVTDPPWGLHVPLEQSNPYTTMLQEFHRVLKPRGILVVLSGSDVLTTALENTAGFETLKTYPLLVSGKKALIIKLQKK